MVIQGAALGTEDSKGQLVPVLWRMCRIPVNAVQYSACSGANTWCVAPTGVRMHLSTQCTRACAGTVSCLVLRCSCRVSQGSDPPAARGSSTVKMPPHGSSLCDVLTLKPVGGGRML